MATSRYHGEQDPRHHGKLHWPGIRGIPFRGDFVPTMKSYELQKLEPVGDTFHQTFDLSDSKQSEDFNWIRSRARNNWFIIEKSHYEWDKDKQNMIVYMEWTQIYYEVPPNRLQGTSDGNYFDLRGG